MLGRDHERQQLLKAYERTKRSGYLKQELFLIQGPSGTGKTTLAKSIEAQVFQQDDGFFLSGKFELSQVQRPYEVFMSAFDSFLEKMYADGVVNERTNQVRRAIRETIGAEGSWLINMIPALEKFIGAQSDNCEVGGKEALQRFQFLFSKLLRATSSVAPMVLFLDDLQWSDPASLSLLQMVLESETRPNHKSCLLVICAYRDDGVNEEQAPNSSNTVPCNTDQQLKGFVGHISSSALTNCTKVALENLDQETIRRLVVANLNLSPELGQKLGSIVYAKCEGNPFHAMQLLGPMTGHVAWQQDGTKMKRVLEEADIFHLAEAAETVDEMICQKLSLLAPTVQETVFVAACMGNCIDHPALCTIFDGNVASVEESLKIALSEGLLVYDRKLGEYRFSHDRIRQGALSMINDIDAKSFAIGHKLWTKSSPMHFYTKMFLIVNLLNHGVAMIQDQQERYKAAAVNLEAGLKAASLASFQDASHFFRSGIEFLEGGDYWIDQYDLSLSLFNASADAELCNQQNSSMVDELVETIFRRARCLKDKLRAYAVKIDSLGQRGRVEGATQVGMEVMKQLREPLPRNSKLTNFAILLEIAKTRHALRGRDSTKLLNLPPMQDEDKIAAMYVLTNLVPYTFQASSNYIVVIGARLVRLCLKYGMHKCCAQGFVTFAFVICALDSHEGYRLGKLSLTIVERYRAKELLPRVYMNFYGLVHHWTRPLEESLVPLAHAYKIGMEIGEVEYALMCFCFYLGHWVDLGKPLADVEDMLNEALRRMRLFHQDHVLEMILIFTQFIHNITGRAPDTKVLAGDASPPFDPSKEVDSLLVPYFHYNLGAELAFLFGDLGLAGDLLEKNRLLGYEPLGFFHLVKMCCKEALICTAIARASAKKKRSENVKRAKAMLKQMKAWAKDCPENFLHKQHLIEAELNSLTITAITSTKRKNGIRAKYDRAIAGALEARFLEEAAVANELAGDLMDRQQQHDSALAYWSEAKSLFNRWGASEKSRQLSLRMERQTTET